MMRKSYDQLTSGFERLFELASRNQEYRSFLIIKGN